MTTILIDGLCKWPDCEVPVGEFGWVCSTHLVRIPFKARRNLEGALFAWRCQGADLDEEIMVFLNNVKGFLYGLWAIENPLPQIKGT